MPKIISFISFHIHYFFISTWNSYATICLATEAKLPDANVSVVVAFTTSVLIPALQ